MQKKMGTWKLVVILAVALGLELSAAAHTKKHHNETGRSKSPMHWATLGVRG